MLLNVSYNEPDVKQKIEAAVGKPFSLKERWSKGGIGSSKLLISQTSDDINNLLMLDNNQNTCNIELRPKGIIIRFRSLLETYGLIIPYYKLTLYKGKAQEYSIYKDKQFIKVVADNKSTFKFFSKLISEKASNQLPGIEDLLKLHFTVCITGINLSWSSDRFFVESHFFPLSDPTRQATNGKHYGKHFGWNPKCTIDYS